MYSVGRDSEIANDPGDKFLGQLFLQPVFQSCDSVNCLWTRNICDGNLSEKQNPGVT